MYILTYNSISYPNQHQNTSTWIKIKVWNTLILIENNSAQNLKCSIVTYVVPLDMKGCICHFVSGRYTLSYTRGRWVRGPILPCDVSLLQVTLPLAITSWNAGQPQCESYFSSDLKSGFSHMTQEYTPSSFVRRYLPLYPLKMWKQSLSH